MESWMIVLLIALCGGTASGAVIESKEAALFNSLLANTNYDKRIKPTVEADQQIIAYVQFGLSRIESLDEKEQVLSSFGWLMLQWYDELLQWDPVAQQIEQIVVPAENIWMPEVAMLNSIDEGNDLTLDTDFRVSIQYDGMVMWGPGFRWRTACAVDLTYFPFDSQTCDLYFVNWMYTGHLLNYSVPTSDVIMDSFTPNGEWDLVDVTQFGSRMSFPTFSEVYYPKVTLRLTMKRVATYFVMNVVIPSVLLTFLSITVYWLPYESGEKVSLGITVLLSFSIVLLMISDVTPRNGNSLPILSWYILATMSITGLSLMLTIAILNIYHHSPTKPVPAWVDKLVLCLLARVLFMHTPNDVSRNCVHPADDVILEDMTSEKAQKVSEEQKYPLMPPDVLMYVRQLMQKEKEKDVLDHNRDQWVLVGRVVDRFFLVLFFIAMTLTAIIMMPLLSLGGK